MSFALVLAASIASCPIENARYELRGSTGVTARFYAVQASSDWPIGLVLRIHVERSGRSYWFLPWQGGTDRKTNLAWVRERNSPIQYQTVRRDVELFTMDRAYNPDPEVPQAYWAAPAHMFIPGLGPLAWYSTTDVNRDSIARTFFDLAGCDASKSTEAAPEIEFPAVP